MKNRPTRNRLPVLTGVSAAVMVIAGAALLFLAYEKPFGWRLYLGYYLVLFGLSAGALAIALALRRRDGRTGIVALIAVLAGAAVLVSGLILQWDYRILLYPSIPRDLTAAEWQADLDFLSNTLRDEHPGFESLAPVDSFAQAVETLRRQIPGLQADEIKIRLSEIAALLNDGHTAILPFQPAFDARLYPLAFYPFADGHYILDAAPAYESAIGYRIRALNGIPVDEAAARVMPLIGAETTGHKLLRLRAWGLIASLLQAQEIGDRQELRLTLERRDGHQHDISLQPVPFYSWLWWAFLRPVANDSWPGVLNIRRDWQEHRILRDSRILYTRLDLMLNQRGKPSLALFADSVKAAINRLGDGYLVIDIRNALGGNNTLVGPLVDVVSEFAARSAGRRVYVLIGPRTFSAAVNFVALLTNRFNPVLVGAPTGQGPNIYGDPVFFNLPNSRISLAVSSRYWLGALRASPNDPFVPDIPVQYTYSHYLEGNDPAMTAVLAHIREQDRPEPGSFDPFKQSTLTAGRYEVEPDLLLDIVESEVGYELALRDYRQLGLLNAKTRFNRASGRRVYAELADVWLERGQESGGGDVTLFWKGASAPLRPLPSGYRHPVELLTTGALVEAERQLAALAHRERARYEGKINSKGYELLEAGDIETAISVFRVNTRLFPGSANCYDSLAEALLHSGDRTGAIANYERALQIDPEFSSAKNALSRLR